MLVQATLEKMQTMKLSAMAEALEAQRRSSEYTELSFEERLGLLIDTEWTARENRKLARRLRAAKMRHAASIENIDFKPPRGLNRQELLALGSCAWIQGHHNLLMRTDRHREILSLLRLCRACLPARLHGLLCPRTPLAP